LTVFLTDIDNLAFIGAARGISALHARLFRA
jgi:hypothetical protein